MNRIFKTNHIKEHEKRVANKREQLGFRDFLIHRFLVILLYVVISEYLVKTLMDRLMVPTIQKLFFENLTWESTLTFSETMFFLVLLIVEILLKSLNNIVPAVARGWVQNLIRQVDERAEQMLPDLGISSSNMNMEALEVLYLFLMIFALIVLFLTPLVIAALWFSRIVINEVRRMEENKEALRLEYEKKRNLMLSDIAHDLRTPITTISGYAKALNDGMVKDEKKQREYLEAIENKSERMSDLINLLFDYVRMDSAGFELKKERVDLSELLLENAALLYSDVEEKEKELEIDIPEEKCMVELDSLQFSRVITNLINNAIRHNEKGTVISLKMIREDDEVSVIVSDNGTAIPQEIADHIFEPFIMGDASRRTKGGSGLGLSIAKKIIEMHGWTIELKQNYLEYKKAFIIKLKL